MNGKKQEAFEKLVALKGEPVEVPYDLTLSMYGCPKNIINALSEEEKEALVDMFTEESQK